jgi:thioredoxin-dependent peroxiredoxin
MLETGAIVPDFTLTNQDGQAVSLHALRGRPVLIFAFPRAGTPGCTDQACGFRDAFPSIEAAGATVLGISPDTPADLKRWQEKEGLPYDLLSDPDHEVLEAWGAWGERSMYGKKYMGVIRSHWLIDAEGRLAEAHIKVSPGKSVELGVKALVSA